MGTWRMGTCVMMCDEDGDMEDGDVEEDEDEDMCDDV